MISVFKSSSLGPVLLHFKQHVNNKEIVQWHWQHLLRLNSRSCSKVLHLPFFKGLWGLKRLLNLLYVIHFFPSHLLQWHLMHLSFFFFFFFILCWLSWSFTFVPFAKFFFSSLSFNLAFSPTFIFCPAHSPVCSHFCHSSSFSLDWLSFISHNIILFFYCFVWLCGNFFTFSFSFQRFPLFFMLHSLPLSLLPCRLLYLFFPNMLWFILLLSFL